MLSSPVLTSGRASRPVLVTQERRRQARWGQLRIAIGGGRDVSDAAADIDVAHSRAVVVQADNAAYVATLKAKGFTGKVYRYTNFSTSKSSTFTDGSSSVGVPLGIATANNWLINDAGGNPIALSAFTNLFCCDPGNTAYIDQWDAIAGPDAKSKGFDGLFLDDCNPYLRSTAVPAGAYAGAYSPDFSTPATDPVAYQSALHTGLSRLKGLLNARGLDVVPNVGAWSDTNYINASDATAAIFGTGLLEQFTSFNFPPSIQSRVALNDQINRVIKLQKLDGAFWGLGHGDITNTQVARLTIACLLLGIEGPGRGLVGMADSAYTGTTPQFTDFSYDPGTPTEDAQQLSTYVWRRQFTNGQVWVNTDTSATATVSFGGTYSGSGLTSQTGTTIALQTALLLSPG